MKKVLRNTLFVAIPFFIMALTNETFRLKLKNKTIVNDKGTSINSADFLSNKCSWICHNNTNYCKKHHVKYLKPLFSITDIFYMGLIGKLSATGNYVAANIIFLVFLIPLIILFFTIKIIDLQEVTQEFNNHKA